MDWTKVNPSTLTLWYAKLAYHRFDEDLTEDELKARHTLRTVSAILDLGDPPSGQGYYAKTISEYHAKWLQDLPLFDRIGHIEPCTDFTTGQLYYRLWLLSDWNASEYQVRRRKEIHRLQTQAWLEQRVKFWRVYRALRKLGIGAASIQDILNNAAKGLAMKMGESEKFLDTMGFNNPADVTQEEIDSYVRDFAFKPGHVYSIVSDFTTSST